MRTSLRVVLASAVLIGWQHILLAADVHDEALALVYCAQQREADVLKGIEWEWIVEKGKTSSYEEALQGLFDKRHSIERYKCRWLSNNGVFLYESIAQQPRRLIEDDREQRIVLTTEGSDIYLSTAKSRLHFDPTPFAGWHGDVADSQHGIPDKWGPGSIPVHGGCFGLGRIKNLLDQLSDPDCEISLEDGMTYSRIKSRVLRVRKKDSTELIYHFSDVGFALLEFEHLASGDRRSQMVVLATQKLSMDSDEVELPARAISCNRAPGDSLWSVSQITSTKATLTPAKLSEMVVPLKKNAVFILHPTGRRQAVDFVDEITAENLDVVVETLFSRSQDRAEKAQRKKLLPRAVAFGDFKNRLPLLVLFNAALLIAGIALYFRRRSNQHQ